jgi:hypothetical protein
MKSLSNSRKFALSGLALVVGVGLTIYAFSDYVSTKDNNQRNEQTYGEERVEKRDSANYFKVVYSGITLTIAGGIGIGKLLKD